MAEEITNATEMAEGEEIRSATIKRCLDVSFKLKVLEEAKKTTNRAAGRKFGVDEASVRYWKKQDNEAGHS